MDSNKIQGLKVSTDESDSNLFSFGFSSGSMRVQLVQDMASAPETDVSVMRAQAPHFTGTPRSGGLLGSSMYCAISEKHEDELPWPVQQHYAARVESSRQY